MRNISLLLLAFLLHACCPQAMAQLTAVQKQEVFSKNILGNAGFEGGKAKWTASAGTFATTTTSPMEGLVHATWDAAASGNTLTSTAVAIPVGMRGRNGVVSCLITTASGTATHEIQAYDGTNVLNEVSITSSTVPTRTSATFIFPSSGNIQLRLYANADEPSIAIDDCYVGPAEGYNMANISQATLLGSILWSPTTNCTWSTTTTGTPANFTADSDCTTPTGSNLVGAAIAPSTKVPGIRFSSIPPGELLFIVTIDARSPTNDGMRLRISDGTNATQEHFVIAGTQSTSISSMTGRIRNTTSLGDTTYQIQGSVGSGTGNLFNNAANSPLEISVYHFPSQTQNAVTVEAAAWRVDANISGGHADLGTSDQSSYIEMTNSSWTLTNNTGNGVLTAQIPCSSTNASSGTTCSAGSESNGVVFNLPRAGDVLACVSFTHDTVYNTSGQVLTTFQIVETSNTAQTVVQEGKSRINSGGQGAATQNTTPHRLCGTFSFSAAGQKTLRLMYEQDITATVTSNLVLGDASASIGSRDIHWEVYPINQSFPAPVLVGSVTTTSNSLRVETARIGTCGTSSSVTQRGNWISSISNGTTGKCTLNIISGTFSAEPYCTCSAYGGGNNFCLINNTGSSATAQVINVYDAAANAQADNVNVICVGPR